MSTRDDITQLLFNRGYIEGAPEALTATQIAVALGARAATVSHLVWKMTKEGELVKKEGCGPRGGVGYQLARGEKVRMA